MLPYPDNQPLSLCKKTIGLRVALLRTSDLLRPESRIGRRQRVMFGAPVPETTVHEDGDLRFCEHKIRSTADGFEGTTRDPVTQTKRMYGTAKSELGLRVAPLVGPHARSGALTRRPRFDCSGHNPTVGPIDAGSENLPKPRDANSCSILLPRRCSLSSGAPPDAGEAQEVQVAGGSDEEPAAYSYAEAGPTGENR